MVITMVAAKVTTPCNVLDSGGRGCALSVQVVKVLAIKEPDTFRGVAV